MHLDWCDSQHHSLVRLWKQEEFQKPSQNGSVQLDTIPWRSSDDSTNEYLRESIYSFASVYRLPIFYVYWLTQTLSISIRCLVSYALCTLEQYFTGNFHDNFQSNCSICLYLDCYLYE